MAILPSGVNLSGEELQKSARKLRKEFLKMPVLYFHTQAFYQDIMY